MTIDHYLYQNVTANLYNDFIVIEFKKNSTSFKIMFDFQLVFQIKEHFQEKSKISKSNTLTLWKYNHWIQLKTNYLQNIELWRSYLKKLLNQRGFHDCYKPIKKIGKGNFATVYLVQRLSDGTNFAVKAFLKEEAYRPQKGKEAVINQISIMRRLDHKNIMKLEQVYQTQNSIYLVVQLIEGGQLYQKIKNQDNHRLTVKDIKVVMKSLLEGLRYLHSKNIMHQYLKLQNILFRSNQNLQCVICDFGLSQYSYSKQYIYTRCGTPGFVAPQIVNIKDQKVQRYDEKCDMFSLGIIFHHMLFRKSPFLGNKFNDILFQNRMFNMDFTKHQYQCLSKQSLNLLSILLEKNPQKRISADDALNHNFFFQQTQPFKHKGKIFEQIQNLCEQACDVQKYTNCGSPTQKEKVQQKLQLKVSKKDSLENFHTAETCFKGNTNTINEISSKDSLRMSVALKKSINTKKTNKSRFNSSIMA